MYNKHSVWIKVKKVSFWKFYKITSWARFNFICREWKLIFHVILQNLKNETFLTFFSNTVTYVDMNLGQLQMKKSSKGLMINHTYRYQQVPTGAHRYQQVPTGTHRYQQIPTGTHRYQQEEIYLFCLYLPILRHFQSF